MADAEDERVLYGAWISPYFSTVAQMLRESDIPFRYERVSPFTAQNRSEEHYGRNVLGKIPTFVDYNGTTLSESLAICKYLARTCSSAQEFYPCNDPERCAEVDTVNDFITFSISGPFFLWFVVGKHFPVAWKMKTDEESRIFSLWSMMMVNGDIRRLLDGADTKPYLTGERPSVADFQLFYVLEHGRTFAVMLDDPSFDLRKGDERLEAFYESMCARPSTRWVLEQRAAEYEKSKAEYFEKMEAGFSEMIQGAKPFLASMFGHDV